MKKTVYIVVSCTDRKRLPAPAELRLRNVAGIDTVSRANYWCHSLFENMSAFLPAQELYLGDHWSVCRSLPDAARTAGFNAELWVASAGYGLIPATSLLHAYSATFAFGHNDSVGIHQRGAPGEETKSWWAALASHNLVGHSRRKLSELAGDKPRSFIVFVASPDYVLACSDDLMEAGAVLSDPDHLVVVTSRGFRSDGPIQHNIVLSDARLRRRLGGSLISLNARITRNIFQEAPKYGLSATALRSRYSRMIAATTPLKVFSRKVFTDNEVQGFIAEELNKETSATFSSLLRKFRDGGNACEQSRFKSLFWRVRDAN